MLEQCAQQKKGQKCEVLVNGLLATSTALTFEHSLVVGVLKRKGKSANSPITST